MDQSTILTEIYKFNFIDFFKNYPQEDFTYFACYCTIFKGMYFSEIGNLDYFVENFERIFDNSIEYDTDKNRKIPDLSEHFKLIYSIYDNIRTFEVVETEKNWTDRRKGRRMDFDVHIDSNFDLHYKRAFLINESSFEGVHKFGNIIDDHFSLTRISTNFLAPPLTIKYFALCFDEQIDILNILVDIILSGMQNRLVKTQYVFKFKSILRLMSTTKTYELFLDVLLCNKELLKKFILVTNFILHPEEFIIENYTNELIDFFKNENFPKSSTNSLSKFKSLHLQINNDILLEGLNSIIDKEKLKKINEFTKENDNKIYSINTDDNLILTLLEKDYINNQGTFYKNYSKTFTNFDEKVPGLEKGFFKVVNDLQRICNIIDEYIFENDKEKLKDDYYRRNRVKENELKGKIAKTVELKSIVNEVNKEELGSSKKSSKINNENKNEYFGNELFEGFNNLSVIPKANILNSLAVKEFIEEYLEFEPNYSNLRQFKQVSMAESISVFPFIVDYAFSAENGDKIDSVLLVLIFILLLRLMKKLY